MTFVRLPDIVDMGHPDHDFQHGYRLGEENGEWETLKHLLDHYNKRYKTNWRLTYDD